ncbi:MAG TPA: hypothetical protein P5523_09260, partial [Bacteroidales bacterium]|nr:hypothetical protein [Bacteroidales bacterium]
RRDQANCGMDEVVLQDLEAFANVHHRGAGLWCRLCALCELYDLLFCASWLNKISAMQTQTKKKNVQNA